MTERELILTNILDCSRADLYLNKPLLNERQFKQLENILLLRKQGQPLQYLLGECEFMGLCFKVSKDVLVPRPETELLVEKVIKISLRFKGKRIKMLDVGTGSGNIAISLAKFIPNALITAIDIELKALEVAKVNAELNNVAEKIEFVRADLFNFDNFDFIISNPPYITSEDIDNLQAEVQYEPRVALDGGIDGLDFYRRIIKESPLHLKNDGFLVMEMGYNQSESIKKIAKNSEIFELLDIIKDYAGIERVIILKKR